MLAVALNFIPVFSPVASATSVPSEITWEMLAQAKSASPLHSLVIPTVKGLEAKGYSQVSFEAGGLEKPCRGNACLGHPDYFQVVGTFRQGDSYQVVVTALTERIADSEGENPIFILVKFDTQFSIIP